MREIIFKGKSKESGEWIYGVPCYFDDSRHIVKYLYNAEGGYVVGAESEEVIPDTIGQYTGLKDKNGTKIFEGDIVTGLFDFELSINAVVEFRDGAFGLLANQHNVEHFHPFTSLCNIEYEVIGNIHDNPELLKGVRE